MHQDKPSVFLSHGEVAELLPFLVNGSLSDAERALVTAHVRTCGSCRQALEFDRGLRDEFLKTTITQQAAHDSFRRLGARLQSSSADAATPRPAVLKPAPRESWWQSGLEFAHAGGRWRIAGAMLPIALIAAFVIAWAPTPWTRGDYHTLSRAESTSGDIDVMFKEHTDAARMQTVLAAIQAEIVAGPNVAGAYSVRFKDGSLTHTDLELRLATLRQDPAVALAAPALPVRSEGSQ